MEKIDVHEVQLLLDEGDMADCKFDAQLCYSRDMDRLSSPDNNGSMHSEGSARNPYLDLSSGDQSQPLRRDEPTNLGPEHLSRYAELPGYELLISDVLDLGDGLGLTRAKWGATPISSEYTLSRDGEVVGFVSLNFGLKLGKVDFDIEVYQKGQNLGINTMQRLANLFGERGLALVTAGIKPESRPYWERRAEEGLVVAENPNDPSTQYIVSPGKCREDET